MNEKFEAYLRQLPLLTERLRTATPLTAEQIRSLRIPGVYSFSEQGNALYLGRTRDFSKRHTNHCGASSGHNSAAFAFLLAREATHNLKPSYQAGSARKDLMKDAEFVAAFRGAKQRINSMETRFVKVEDHNLQHLLELYASLELNSKYNKFETT